MAEKLTIEEEALRQAKIAILKEEYIEKLRQEGAVKAAEECAQVVDEELVPQPSSQGSWPLPRWLVIMVLVVLSLIAWAVSEEVGKKTASPPPPPPVVSSSQEEMEEWWARLGIGPNSAQEPASPTDRYDSPMGSYKPSHEGLGFYGADTARTMWD